MNIRTKLVLLAKLVFAPEAFIQSAADTDLAAGKFSDRQNSEQLARQRTGLIRRKQFRSFLQILVLVLLGYGLSMLINQSCPLQEHQIRVARLVGVSIIAWAALARLGWEVQSMAGNTVPEVIHSFAFRFFYSIGVFLTVAALFLEP